MDDASKTLFESKSNERLWYIKTSTNISPWSLKWRCRNLIKFRIKVKHAIIIFSINKGTAKFMQTYTKNILLGQLRYRENERGRENLVFWHTSSSSKGRCPCASLSYKQKSFWTTGSETTSTSSSFDCQFLFETCHETWLEFSEGGCFQISLFWWPNTFL